jgi:hypothetical protein
LNACFDFGVAIRAEENAFPSLLPCRLDAAGKALTSEAKPLLSRIEVVELEGAHEAVVPADAAAPAGLIDEDLLDSATTVGHLFLPTELAAVGAAGIEPEAHQAVLAAGSIRQ